MNWINSSMLIMAFAAALLLSKPLQADATSPSSVSSSCPDTLNYSFRRLGEDKLENLCDTYKGKLILVVNTASKCAFTPQYDGLESLYRQYKAKGLVVLGFPSNDFAGQEPGTEKEILSFCRLTYSVEFPMFEKIHAAQGKADPFFVTLADSTGEYPGWNFHKYLIAPDGKVIRSFRSFVKPTDPELVRIIEENLPHG
jgi:glutathione peroxidase